MHLLFRIILFAEEIRKCKGCWIFPLGIEYLVQHPTQNKHTLFQQKALNKNPKKNYSLFHVLEYSFQSFKMICLCIIMYTLWWSE